MKIDRDRSFSIEFTEEDLKKALEYYLLVVHSEKVKVTSVEHLVGNRTEGFGHTEMDIPYQEGLKLTCVEYGERL